MDKGKIVKTEFFVSLNKELYKIVHSWEEFQTVKEEEQLWELMKKQMK